MTETEIDTVDRCPKCGQLWQSGMWHASKWDCTHNDRSRGLHADHEHLHFYCRCGFRKTENTKDVE